MKQLSTIAVEDWGEFVKRHGLTLACDCDMRGCGNCNNRGDVWPTSRIAYDTGYIVAGNFPRVPYTGTVAFEYELRIWLTCFGLLQDDSGPFLGMAWIKLFPNCSWVPEQFGDAGSVDDYYRLLPKADADLLTAKLRASLVLNLVQSQAALEQLDKFQNERNHGVLPP